MNRRHFLRSCSGGLAIALGATSPGGQAAGSGQTRRSIFIDSAAGVPGTSASSNCKVKRAAVYVRRRPERSAAYQVVRENLET